MKKLSTKITPNGRSMGVIKALETFRDNSERLLKKWEELKIQEMSDAEENNPDE